MRSKTDLLLSAIAGFGSQVTFSGALNVPGEPETFTAIIHNERLKLSDCHMFHVNSKEAKGSTEILLLGDTIRD